MKGTEASSLVRDLRARLGLTQEQFARRLGVTYSTVNHWENGRRTPQPFLMAGLLALDAKSAEALSRDAETARGESMGTATPAAVRTMVDRIVQRFQPERVILFGSHARGDAGPDSDVDLLVVRDVEGGRRQKQLELRGELRDVRIPKDVVVTTPGDFAWRRHVPGTVERAAALEGRVLYAR